MKTCPVILVLCAALLAGCATQPDARIRRSPEIFARLTAEQQELVKAGKAGIGFDQDAVRLAMGEPDRKWTRTDASGVREMWIYTDWENTAGQPLMRGWYHGYQTVSPAYYLNAPARRERDRFKVVFGADGKVAAIEQAEDEP